MLKLLFLLILWIPRWILSYLKQIWSRKRYPPGPFPLPVMRSMWRLLGTGISETTFTKLAKQYGNIYSLWGGPYHIIILSGYQAVKEGLIDHSEAFADRPVTPFILASTQKRGIVFSNGHIWKQQRRFSVVTMRKLGLGKKGMESQIQEEAQQLVEFFAETKGQPFDPSLPIMRSICSVICAVAFGRRFSTDDKDFLELMEAISISLKFGSSIFYILYEGFPNIMKHLPGFHQTALSALETIVSVARKEITQHKENQNLHELQDFTDSYLFQMEKGKDDLRSTYNEDNLAQCIADLFIAGTDTTYASLKWAMLLMANNLDIQDKVHKEVDEVFGSSLSICYNDQKKLPYTNAVIHEIIRKKYPFLFGIPRQCVQDVYLNGFLIPKRDTPEILEITEAIKKQKKDKTPGPDGLPAEFYVALQDIITPTLKDLWNELFIQTKIPDSWTEANITLIPKEDTDHTLIKKYRPISLLNVDYKIFAAIMAERMKNFLTETIHPDQNGFLPKRQIKNNLRIILNVLEYYEIHSIDAQKDGKLKGRQVLQQQGARACLGELLAKTEFFNIFTRLLRQFRLEPPEGVEKLSEKSIIGVSVHPSPYKICAVPRIRTA